MDTSEYNILSHSEFCSITTSQHERNLVDLEWRSADCSAPWRRRPVHIARQDTAVQSRVNTWTPTDTAWTWWAVRCPASVDRRVEVASDHGRIFVCRWWLAPRRSWPAAVCRSRFSAHLRTVNCPHQLFLHGQLGQWMSYDFVADSFNTKKLCTRLSSSEVRFYTEKPFCCFLSLLESA